MRRPRRICVLRSRDGLDEIFAWLRRGPLAVDTETSGLRWAHGDVVGAINLAAHETAIVAFGSALEPTARWLSDQVKAGRELVFHNSKFDMHMLDTTFGLHVPYPVHDTVVESFIVDNRGANAFGWRTKKKHSLKELATVYVDPDALDPEAELLAAIRRHGGKHKGDWPLLINTPDEHYFTDYAAYDPWYTLQLHLIFDERITNWRQPYGEDYAPLRSVYEREQWVLLACRDMETRGIRASRRFLEQWRDELAVQLEKEKRHLWKLAGKREINWNSWQQLLPLLHTLGVNVTKTDAVTLLDVAHPIGPAIVKHRET